MAIFDAEKAAAALGKGNLGIIDSLGMGFGIPNCLLNLTKSALSILPSDILTNMSQSIEEGKDSANRSMAKAVKSIFGENGIIEFNTESGTLQFRSGSSKYGLDRNEEKFIAGLDGLGKILGAGAQVYANIGNVQQQIDDVKDCMDILSNATKFQSGNSATFKAGTDFSVSDLPTTADLVSTNYAGQRARIDSAMDFTLSCNAVLGNINSILSERGLDSTLEPCFDDSFFETSTVQLLKNAGFLICPSGETAVLEEDPFFDLVFGPPKSKKGQFILTTDGLYYNYTSALSVEVSSIHADSIPSLGKKWLFDFDPNLGGKGTQVSLKDLDRYVSTIFDLEVIDEGISLVPFYDNDHFLQVLKDNRDKQVYDLSSEFSTIISTYGENSAIAINMRQNIYSNIASHEIKIKKRKKQIEIAVKAPSLYGTGAAFTLGNIPVNDFSYLADINLPVALDKQEKLAFSQGEVSGVVLPLKPKFVIPPATDESIAMHHLVVPPVGVGGIITSTSGLDPSSATILSLTDDVITDQLLLIYNFLSSKIITDPSSTSFQVLNCASTDLKGNGQLVGVNASSVFPSGLGIPLLKGIGEYNPTTLLPSAVGSYVKLPDITELQNLTYSSKGFTFDFWVHVPKLGDLNDPLGWENTGVSSLHKLVLACENTGGSLEKGHGPSFSSESTRGMTMGFTRDKQIRENKDPVDASASNEVSSGLSFYIAPTQGVGAGDADFVNKADNLGCKTLETYHFMAVDTSNANPDGVKVNDTSSSFVHMVVSVDVDKNTVKFILDGSLLATSSVSETFGVDAFQGPGIPSFHNSNSFNYASSGTLVDTVLANGPPLYPYFTPWIIGGGYTDGLTESSAGGFMGLNSGVRSGLGGFLGSFKIYQKPLSEQEAKVNFDAQKGFFKNIIT